MRAADDYDAIREAMTVNKQREDPFVKRNDISPIVPGKPEKEIGWCSYCTNEKRACNGNCESC